MAIPVVLIVEDEPLVLEIASDEFEDIGCRVIRAWDEKSARLAIEGSEHIDLLFTDIRIPGEIDGWSLASLARKLRPGMPVIYATGYTADQPTLVPDSRFFKKPYRIVDVIDAARSMGLAV